MKFDHLLQSQEGKLLEFKRDLSSSENTMKTLVAFANTAGGIIFSRMSGYSAVVLLAQKKLTFLIILISMFPCP